MMRTTITTERVGLGQWHWLREEMRRPVTFGAVPGEPQVCVTFVSENSEAVHAELSVRRFSKILAELHYLARVAEAALSETPGPVDPAPAEAPDFSRIGTNSGHGWVWERPDGLRARCGGAAICTECQADRELLNANMPKR